MDSDPDTGGPKICGSRGSGNGFGSGSATLVLYYLHLVIEYYKNTPAVNKGKRLRMVSLALACLSIYAIKWDTF
jgi:hypothetical protein